MSVLTSARFPHIFSQKTLSVFFSGTALRIILGIAFSAAALTGCSSSVRFTSAEHSTPTPTGGGGRSTTTTPAEPVMPGTVLRGFASYYGDEFQGRLTSNGEVFNQRSFTAAHRNLPFGTKVRVINMKNNRSVFVRINDRGPFVENRVIDLSRAAAEQLDMLKDGVAQVVITVVEAN